MDSFELITDAFSTRCIVATCCCCFFPSKYIFIERNIRFGG